MDEARRGCRLTSGPIREPGPMTIDGMVGFPDLVAVLAAWGDEGEPEDLDGSGVVGFGDLLLLLAAWGPCE